jgi:hypothetical protein
MKKCIIFIFLYVSFSSAYSQYSVIISRVKGVVLDSATNEPVEFSPVQIKNKSNSLTLTDASGNFTLTLSDSVATIIVSCVGYKPVELPVHIGMPKYIIKLQPTVQSINEVVVKPKKERYRNKNNPAVEIIEKVIKNRPLNRMEDMDFYSYDKYEKTQLSLSDYSENLRKKRLLKNFQFVFDNFDTTSIPGKKILPLYLRETLANDYYLKSIGKVNEVVFAEKSVHLDEYIHERTLNYAIQFLYQDINIYDNNIMLLSNQFLSPISNIAPTFYKYFILDTALVGNSKCVRLAFFPRNKADFLFQGQMYVMLDSTNAIRKIEMTVNKAINLNWVKELLVDQEFENSESKGWVITKDNIFIDFGLSAKKTGVFGQRSVLFRHYNFDMAKADSIINSLNKIVEKNPGKFDDTYWEKNRFKSLNIHEQKVYGIIDSLKKVPAFKNEMDVAALLISGFYGPRNFFEIGPINTFYSYNPIEGSRIKLGGRTTNRFSKKINFETYGAYGTLDKKFKYYGSLSYSLTPNSVFDFPVKDLKISYQNDIKIPGQEFQFAQENNILLSLKRGTNDKMYYNHTFKLEHNNEFANHFSYMVGYEYTDEIPTGNLFFNTQNSAGSINKLQFINLSQININLRYAPHEEFLQAILYRHPIVNKYPVFQLQYSGGTTITGNDFDYQKISLNISERFYLSFLGFTDIMIEGGKIFGQVPFPLLDVHRANQTYAYQANSYNLMNFLEFVSDKYVSINAQHSFNGFFLNKIPIIKKLKWREIITLKMLYGGLSSINDPNKNSNLLKFPIDNAGVPITYTFGSVPYTEASVGISNIFNVFRIEFVRRLTYLNHPGISRNGIRLNIDFDF